MKLIIIIRIWETAALTARTLKLIDILSKSSVEPNYLFTNQLLYNKIGNIKKLVKTMGEKIIILGSGGHGKVVKEIAEACGYEVIGFVGDNKPVGTKILDKKVLCRIEDIGTLKSETLNLAVAVGANTVREKRAKQVLEMGFVTPALVHPSCIFSKSAEVGMGTVIMAGTVVNSEAYIGDFCIINTGATVDHDCRVGDFCHISPGANLGGEVTIRDYTWVGVGAAVRECITIGKNVMIGGSAFVACDIEDNVTAVGVPAKVMKRD